MFKFSTLFGNCLVNKSQPSNWARYCYKVKLLLTLTLNSHLRKIWKYFCLLFEWVSDSLKQLFRWTLIAISPIYKKNPCYTLSRVWIAIVGRGGKLESRICQAASLTPATEPVINLLISALLIWLSLYTCRVAASSSRPQRENNTLPSAIPTYVSTQTTDRQSLASVYHS